MKKAGLGIVAFVFAVYFGLGTLLVVAQRLLIFPAPDLPRQTRDAHAARTGADVIEVTAADGTRLYGWHRPATGDKAVILFHGNAATVVWEDQQALLAKQGFDVFIIAYRGYPGSEGSPSEEGLVQDAQAVWKYVSDTLKLPPERIVLHGKSLGGGVAAQLASRVNPGALVLESTFTSVDDIAGATYWMYPTSILVRDRFRTRDVAKDIHCPVLVMHGVGDRVIPVSHGRALSTLFEKGTYVEVQSPEHGLSLSVWEPTAQAAYFELLNTVSP